jgi:hypothetical protein
MADQAVSAERDEEDGWVFRVKTGVPIEYRRDGDDTQPEVSPPHHPRHNYPST